jgi:erythromycin esterase
MRKRIRDGFALLACALAGCDGDAVQASMPMPVLPQGIDRLAGTDPSLPDDDLAPLDSIVGDAPVVALGESVHTSGGYSAAKVRLFEHLVQRLNFRVFAFESPRTDAEKTASYVATCQGTPEQALRGLFSVWGNSSTRDLVTWMCQWNQQHPQDPVRLYGFDIQQPWDDGHALRAFLPRVGQAGLLAGIAACEGATAESADAYYATHPQGPPPITAAQNQACLDGVAAIDEAFAAHEADIIAATSGEALTEARMATRSLRAWEGQVYHSDVAASMAARDEGMADVFTALRALRFPDARVVVWAHNFHISAHQDEVEYPYDHAKSMGSFLKDRLGDSYRPVGLVGYHVDINWPGTGCGPMALPTAPDAVELLLHGLGEPSLLVDLGATPFFVPGESYELGGETEGLGSHMVPSRAFRALVYLDHTPAMEALFWPPCQAMAAAAGADGRGSGVARLAQPGRR